MEFIGTNLNLFKPKEMYLRQYYNYSVPIKIYLRQLFASIAIILN